LGFADKSKKKNVWWPKKKFRFRTTMVNLFSGDVEVEARDCSTLTEDELQVFYHFSNDLMTEAFESFERHVKLHELVYVFFQSSSSPSVSATSSPSSSSSSSSLVQHNRKMVGFSFWRWKPTSNLRVKAIVQGKLRILKDQRRKSLHVRAGILYYFRKQWQDPFATFYFVSIASIFNFVSMRRGVSQYGILNRTQQQSLSKVESRFLPLYEILDDLIEEDKFEKDPNTGAIDVHIIIRKEVLEEYPESFYRLPEALEYIEVNPKYREGYDNPFRLHIVIHSLSLMSFGYFGESWIRLRLDPSSWRGRGLSCERRMKMISMSSCSLSFSFSFSAWVEFHLID
jgi:hypothetical protein